MAMNPALLTSKESSNLTPHLILTRTLRAMGGIDLDPCAEPGPPFNVPATKHYTEADDGLAHTWYGRVFMNPPYGRAISAWVHKLDMDYRLDRIDCAIALLPARTDTRWMHVLQEYPRCYLWGRLKFKGHKTGAPFPSVVIPLGIDMTWFCQVFQDLGDIYTWEDYKR